MRVRSISGREVRLFASPRTIDDFKKAIEVGEVLRGRIIEVFPENKVLVSFKGFNLIAETLLSFKKTDIFYAQVQAKSPKILVKILLPNERPHSFTDEDAEDFIRQLGLRPSPNRIKIVKHLIRHNLAVTREMVDAVERLLPLLDGNLDENITTLAFMKAHGLKPSPENVELIKLHLFNRLNIGKALEELQRILAGMDFVGRERLRNIIQGMFIRLDKGNVSEQIKNFIESIGIGYENELFNGFGLDGGRQQKNFEDILYRDNLKIKLLSIIKRLDEESLDPDRIKLQGAISRLLKHIFSFQLTSCQEGEDSYFYLQLPIQPGDGVPQLVELKVYYQDKESKIDMDYLNFSLLFHTSRLGLVEVRVSLCQGVSNVEFRLEDEYKKMFLRREIPSLEEGLLGLGYRIGKLTCLVKGEDGFHSEKEIDLASVGRIDLRV